MQSGAVRWSQLAVWLLLATQLLTTVPQSRAASIKAKRELITNDGQSAIDVNPLSKDGAKSEKSMTELQTELPQLGNGAESNKEINLQKENQILRPEKPASESTSENTEAKEDAVDSIIATIPPFDINRYTSGYRQEKKDESQAEALGVDSYTTVDYERQFERMELTTPAATEFDEAHKRYRDESSLRFDFDHSRSSEDHNVEATTSLPSSIEINLDAIDSNSTNERNSSTYFNNAEVDNKIYQTNTQELKIESPSENVEQSTNEVIGTGAKRGKYLQNPEEATVINSDVNDLTIPNTAAVWALAGMKRVDHTKTKAGLYYNITNERNLPNNLNNVNATSATKILADWTEIMKNNEFLNTSAIKNEIPTSNTPEKNIDERISDGSPAEQNVVENKLISVIVTAPPPVANGKPSRFDEAVETTTEFDYRLTTEDSFYPTELSDYLFNEEVTTDPPEFVTVTDSSPSSKPNEYEFISSYTTEKIRNSIQNSELKKETPPSTSLPTTTTVTEQITESNHIITESPKSSTVFADETIKSTEPTKLEITTELPDDFFKPIPTTNPVVTTESDVDLPAVFSTEEVLLPSTTTTTTTTTTTNTTTTELPPTTSTTKAPIISTLNPEINSIERITETEIVESNNLPEYTVVDSEKDRYKVTTQNTTEAEMVHVESLPEKPTPETAVQFVTKETSTVPSVLGTVKTTTVETMVENKTNGHQMFSPIIPTKIQTKDSGNSSDHVELGSIGHPAVDDGPDVNAIIAITVSVIAVVALILLVGFLYVMRKRQKQPTYGQRCRPVGLDAYSLDNVSVYNSVRRKGNNLRLSKRSYGNSAFEDPGLKPNPLAIPSLTKFADDQNAIYEEFKEIPLITARVDEVPPGCEDKNRYANVVPLPETRVNLQQQNNDEKTEYINANFVRGPKDNSNYYIACQAPMENTITDFWRMIWEQNSKVVLMLTDLTENGIEKCAEYLPPSAVLDCNRVFGDFNVTLKNREVKEKYAVSTVHLKNSATNTWREIMHFWYQWPEEGMPSDETSVVAMLLEARSYLKMSMPEQEDHEDQDDKLQKIQDLNNELTEKLDSVETEKKPNGTIDKSKSLQRSQGPLTVHCSPGTGRTGTIIACDIALRSLEQKTRTVDLPQIVYYVRRGRASSIKTREQYEFLYRVTATYATKLTDPIAEN